MPLYEYECSKCQHKFTEIILEKEEEKKLRCPKCKSKKWERLFSSFAVVSDLSTDMPKPDLSNLPPDVRAKTIIGDYIEEKDRPKKNR
ncbi:MAG TPA: FmdB family zinc ribbon protein [Thermodesulfobacteriota bacterium]|nr:FmdB family zinc ribbon protein [Thermodesulfobacteriota bacterium]